MRYVRTTLVAVCMAAAALPAASPAAEQADAIDFERQLRPILVERCCACHGA
ncbi:MAG: hypothetical protein ACKOTB_07575 [Planctomycetia bacterium]